MLRKSSVAVAKNRLRILVTSDRVKCSPGDYDNICRELYSSLSKYMELTEDDFKVDICRTHILITFAGDET